MKKSLVIISFAFIFSFIILLTNTNFVSAAECSVPICTTTSTICGSIGGGDYQLIGASCEGFCAKCTGDSCHTGCDDFVGAEGISVNPKLTKLNLIQGVKYVTTLGKKVSLDSSGNLVPAKTSFSSTRTSSGLRGLRFIERISRSRANGDCASEWDEISASAGGKCCVKSSESSPSRGLSGRSR